MQGGRDIRLAAPETLSQQQTMGLGQWLLVSGLQQVSRDLQRVEALLNPPPEQPLLFLLLQGRAVNCASPRACCSGSGGHCRWASSMRTPGPSVTSDGSPTTTAISLRERNAVAVWMPSATASMHRFRLD